MTGSGNNCYFGLMEDGPGTSVGRRFGRGLSIAQKISARWRWKRSLIAGCSSERNKAGKRPSEMGVLTVAEMNRMDYIVQRRSSHHHNPFYIKYFLLVRIARRVNTQEFEVSYWVGWRVSALSEN